MASPGKSRNLQNNLPAKLKKQFKSISISWTKKEKAFLFSVQMPLQRLNWEAPEMTVIYNATNWLIC